MSSNASIDSDPYDSEMPARARRRDRCDHGGQSEGQDHLQIKGLHLAEKSENRLRDSVCLTQHGRAGLLQDLVLGELDHLVGHVCVADP